MSNHDEVIRFLQYASPIVNIRLYTENEDTTWISVKDTSKDLQFNNGPYHLKKFMTIYRNSHGFIEKEANGMFEPMDGYTTNVPSRQKSKQWFADISNLKRFLSYLLQRGTKTRDFSLDTIKRYQLEGTISESYFLQPQTEILGEVQKAIPFESFLEFPVGAYRLDWYCPDLHLGICCDENDHRYYNAGAENKRERFLTKTLNCSLLHFNPYDSEIKFTDMIRKILLIITSPAHQALMRMALPLLPVYDPREHTNDNENDHQNDHQNETENEDDDL
jgi:hypothetical protein